MKLTMHTYQGEKDYNRIRDFLHQVLLLNNYRELSWQPYRFDYWRYHGVENMGHGRLETDVFLWETPEKQIAAVLNREGPGSVFLHIHPQSITPELVNEMLIIAEKHLTITTSNNMQKLGVWVEQNDYIRQNLVKSRGYAKGKPVEYQRRRSMSQTIPDLPVARGLHDSKSGR